MMKLIITKFFSRVALVAGLATVFTGTAGAQNTITIDFEDNALPTGWTNTNDMAVVGNPLSNTSSTNGSYCLSTNGKASNSLTSGLIENILSISVDATRTSNNSTNEVYIDFCPNNSFGNSDTQTKSVTVNKSSWSTSTLTLSNKASGYVRIRRSGGSSTATKFIDNIVITVGSGSSTPTCVTPTFYPATGVYTSTQSVSISTETEGATIYYTTDGTAPTTSSSVYSSAISVSSDMTIKAMAVKTNYDNSTVATATYTFVEHAGTSADPYTVADARKVIDAGVGLTNVYATGIVSEIVTAYDPTYHNISYNISSDGLTTSNQLQAYRGKGIGGADFTSADDIQLGDVVVVYGTLKKYNSTYEFDQNNQLVSLVRKPAAPTFLPAAGAVPEGTEVTISTVTDGATIYYTTDGTDPTTSSSIYSAAITVNAAMTIKAIAVKDEKTSDIATAAYTIAVPVATPTFLPAAGTYSAAQNVTISCETDGATIYYTTNGDTPTTSSTVYSSSISVSETMTIKAIATKENMANSEVASATYTMEIPSIMFDAGNALEVEASATEVSVAFTASFTSGTISAVLCDSEGNAQEYEWIEAGVNNNNVELVFDANTSTTDSRTAYFKLTASNATSPVFTLTQKKYVVDYASLPFEFNSGSSAIANTTGLTQSGLGSDYSSAPKLKFDSTGDYLILKINEEPGTLSFDVLGNSFSGGTFKLQTSADGSSYSDFATVEIPSSKTNKSYDNLASTVRYIKWIYTNKSSGNVALGNISLAKPVASITPASTTINATSAKTDGTLNVTYSRIEGDPEIYWFESDGETAASQPSWVKTSFDASNNVDYIIDANTGDERSAYFKVYGLDGNANDVYSALVTITQEAYNPVVPEGDNYTLFTGDLVEGDYIIYYDGYAMKNTADSDRLQYVEVTPSGNVINTNNSAIVWHLAKNGDYWTIYNAAVDKYAASTGAKNKAQMLSDGTDNKALWSVSDEYEFVNKGNSDAGVNCNLRNNGTYGFACYAKTTGGELSLYKLDTPAAAESINATLHNGLYWATFYSGVARYKLPEGTKAYTMNPSHQLYLLGTDGSVIPAGTAVVIISDTATPAISQIPNIGDITVYGGDNQLRGSSSATAKSSISGTPYVMGIVGGNLGFYKFTGETIPANKAYYIVNE